eukprot:2909499-Pyramimonas_sp.AAC.2
MMKKSNVKKHGARRPYGVGTSYTQGACDASSYKLWIQLAEERCRGLRPPPVLWVSFTPTGKYKVGPPPNSKLVGRLRIVTTLHVRKVITQYLHEVREASLDPSIRGNTFDNCAR